MYFDVETLTPLGAIVLVWGLYFNSLESLLHILVLVKLCSFTLQQFVRIFFKKHTKFSQCFDYIRFNRVESYILTIKNRLLIIMLCIKLDLIWPSGFREKVQECEQFKQIKTDEWADHRLQVKKKILLEPQVQIS